MGTWKYRLDRLGWAHAIASDKNIWGFQGISRLDAKDRRYREYNSLTASLLSSQSYIDNLQYTEIKSIIASGDWNDEWREYVKRRVHVWDQCPNGTKEERHAYGAAFRKLIKNEDKKWEWASERIDWEWLKDQILCMTEQNPEGVACVLKAHPVDEVWQSSNERWIDLSDVTVFCPECAEPMDGCNRNAPEGVEPHPFAYSNSGCDCAYSAELGEHMTCLFNRAGEPRPRFQCPGCGHKAALDSLEDSFTYHYGRPSDWPPGAPYPPRRSFVGEPMDVPPWQD